MMKNLFITLILSVILISCNKDQNIDIYTLPTLEVSNETYPYNWDTVSYDKYYNGYKTVVIKTDCVFNEEYIVVDNKEFNGYWYNSARFISDDINFIITQDTMWVCSNGYINIYTN